MKLYQYTLPLLLSLVLLSSCEEDTFLGADIEGIGGEPLPTSELSASRDTVDFTDGEMINFDLSFEQSTYWLLTLQGYNSGATHTFENVSNSIDESNTLWDGITEAAPFFTEELVNVTVSFPDYPEKEVLSTSFVIDGIEESLIEAVLITDFSTAPIYNFGGTEPEGGGWGSDFPVTVNTNTAYEYFDANAYLYFEGAPWQVNSPYVDIVQIASNLVDTLSGATFPLYSNPERVYVNLAVYNTGTVDTWFKVEFTEASTAESRSWDIRPDWEGWKYISIKYSDLLSEGTQAYDPSSIELTNLVLLSDENETNANRAVVSIAIDQLVFSFDSPLGTVNY